MSLLIAQCTISRKEPGSAMGIGGYDRYGTPFPVVKEQRFAPGDAFEPTDAAEEQYLLETDAARLATEAEEQLFLAGAGG